MRLFPRGHEDLLKEDVVGDRTCGGGGEEGGRSGEGVESGMNGMNGMSGMSGMRHPTCGEAGWVVGPGVELK